MADITTTLEQDQVANSLLSDSDQAALEQEQQGGDGNFDRDAFGPTDRGEGQEVEEQGDVDELSELADFVQEQEEPPQPETDPQAIEENYQQALEHYDELAPEQQAEVCTYHVERGLEQAYAQVDPQAAQELSADLFGGQVDAVPAASTFLFWADNVEETVNTHGAWPQSYEEAAQLTDPNMANLAVQTWGNLLGVPDLAQRVNPMELSAWGMFWFPRLMSGQSSDLVSYQAKAACLQDLCTIFGNPQGARQEDPVRFYDGWSKWGARAGVHLRSQQAAQQQPQERSRGSRRASSGKSSGTRRTSSQFAPQSDAEFWAGAAEAYKQYHGRM